MNLLQAATQAVERSHLVLDYTSIGLIIATAGSLLRALFDRRGRRKAEKERDELDCDAHTDELQKHRDRLIKLETLQVPDKGERLAVLETKVENLDGRITEMDRKNDLAHGQILEAIKRHP